MSLHSLVSSLRRAQYCLLLPFVFAVTWVEAAHEETRHTLALAGMSMAMMVAGLSGVVLIKGFYV